MFSLPRAKLTKKGGGLRGAYFNSNELAARLPHRRRLAARLRGPRPAEPTFLSAQTNDIMCNFPSKKPCASVVCRERIHVDRQTCCCAATASPRAAVVAASRVRAHLDPYCCEGLSFLFARRQGGLEEPRSREAKQTRKTTISKRGNWRSYPFRTRSTLYLGEEAAAQACASAADSSSRASSAASTLFAAEAWRH